MWSEPTLAVLAHDGVHSALTLVIADLAWSSSGEDLPTLRTPAAACPESHASDTTLCEPSIPDFVELRICWNYGALSQVDFENRSYASREAVAVWEAESRLFDWLHAVTACSAGWAFTPLNWAKPPTSIETP